MTAAFRDDTLVIPVFRDGLSDPNQAFDGLALRLKDKLRYRDREFI